MRKAQQVSFNRVRFAERRMIVADLYIREAMTQQQVAERVGVSVATVNRDLKAIRKQWLELARQDYETWIAEQLGEIKEVIRAAWELFVDPPSKTRTKQTKHPESGELTVVEKITETQYPDRGCLETVLKGRSDIAKLLGLNAPDGLDITTKGKQIGQQLDDGARRVLLLALLDRGRERADGQVIDGQVSVVSGTGSSVGSLLESGG